MEQQNLFKYLGIVGSLFSIASLFYAFYQQRQITKLKKIRVKQLRSSLDNTILIMKNSYFLLKRQQELQINENEAITKISMIHSNSTMMIKSIFSELSEVDDPYDLEKLKSYINIGLITSKYLFYQALIFIEKPFLINLTDLKKIEDDLPDDSPDYVDFNSTSS